MNSTPGVPTTLKPWLGSLQFRLAWRLALLYVGITVIALGVLVYRTLQTADSINDHDFTDQVAALARAVSLGPDGMARISLPPQLAAAYQRSAGADAFAIRDAGGRLIAASPAGFGERVKAWTNTATNTPRYFHLKDIGEKDGDYYGFCVRRASTAGPLSIAVARPSGAAALVDALLQEFMMDVAWMIPLLLLVTLGIGVVAIRSGLKTVRDASYLAASIGPQTTSVRLPETGLPTEVAPLVVAVNQALDRLDKGFAVQREFTANAAHELRTPLAILTGALDAIESVEDKSADLVKIRADVARMNRLVEQLLRVARLDAIALDVSEHVDLNEAATAVVANMAPWAIAQQKSLGVTPAESPVLARGNAHAIADAIRNLVENAVAHSPVGAEVSVVVNQDRCVCVIDQGSGITAADHEHIFERFWRGKQRLGDGAGLGLAIVREIMQSHGGSVRVAANPTGGASFTLAFPPPG